MHAMNTAKRFYYFSGRSYFGFGYFCCEKNHRNAD